MIPRQLQHVAIIDVLQLLELWPTDEMGDIGYICFRQLGACGRSQMLSPRTRFTFPIS